LENSPEAATVPLLQREELIESGHRLRVAIVQHIPLPAKSTGIGVAQIASNLLHPFLCRVLGHAGQPRGCHNLLLSPAEHHTIKSCGCIFRTAAQNCRRLVDTTGRQDEVADRICRIR
jgi:hypothetical protein